MVLLKRPIWPWIGTVLQKESMSTGDENCMRTMKYLQKKSLGTDSNLQKSSLSDDVVD